ncbi:MAG: branched-chain amino acid ABC transporter permease [Bdellovibrionales bacterium]|nr:branched-chain amino acid ABC transporter permease [Bdellovibrionales bacterium]
MDYFIHLAILICIYLILAQSFNLTFGLGRLFNLAHVAIYSIGAYTTAILSTDFEQGFLICIAASMALSALFALLIGAISLKLTFDYFAIGTIAFSAVVTALLINWKTLTRGVLGIPGIPRPQFWGIDFYDNQNFLMLIGSFVLISYLLLALVFKNRFARKLQMQAEYVPAAQALGVEIRGIRNDAFILSSIFAGLAGSFYAYYINYVDPTSFSLNEMVFVMSIVIMGKPGSFGGVVASTVFLVLLPEPLRFIEIEPGILGPMRQLLYALLLFGVVYWKRASLFPVQRTV